MLSVDLLDYKRRIGIHRRWLLFGGLLIRNLSGIFHVRVFDSSVGFDIHVRDCRNMPITLN